MTVQMHGMRDWAVVVNDGSCNGGPVQVPEIPPWRQIGKGIVQRMRQQGLVEVRSEALIAHVEEHVSAVALLNDVEFANGVGLLCGKRIRWNGLGERVV